MIDIEVLRQGNPEAATAIENLTIKISECYQRINEKVLENIGLSTEVHQLRAKLEQIRNIIDMDC